MFLFAMSRTIGDSSGRCFPLSRKIRDEYVFHFSMSNRLSDRYPCRGVCNTPLARLSSTPSPFVGRLVGRMQYAPIFPKKDEVSSGRYFLLSRTMADQYVFHSIMSNRLLDRYPCRGVLHTPLARLSSTLSPLTGRLVGRMQYAPTLPAEKSDLKGWWEVTFRTRGDEYVFNFSMSNRLSDRCPCRGVLNTPHNRSRKGYLIARQTIVGHMQYAPTLSEKEEVSSGRYFPLSLTMADQYVFHSSISNQLSDRYPCRGVLNTPHIDSLSTPTSFAWRLVGRMQYAPTLPEKDEVSSGRCFPLSRTMVDKYVSFFSMSNRLSDRHPGRAQKNTPLVRLSSTLSPLAGRLVGRMQYAPTFPEKDEGSSSMCFLLSQTMADQSVFYSIMSNRLSDRYPGRAQKYTPHIDSTSTPSPFAWRLVGRKQYAPTLLEKEEISLGRCFPLSRTMAN